VDAAETVIGGETLEWLAHLVDKSLVLVDEDEATGERRYRLLETIRQYGRDRLLEAGEVSAVRGRHLAYYRQLVGEAEPGLTGPAMLPTLNRLENEIDNLRSALEWALAHNPADALQMAASLKFFWLRRGRAAEGTQWLRDGLAALEADPAGHQAVRAKAMAALGSIYFGFGGLNAARQYLQEAADLARPMGERQTLARSLSMLGLVMVWTGDLAPLDAVLEEVQRLADLPDTDVQTQVLTVRAMRALQNQEWVTARRYAEQGLEWARRSGDMWMIAITHMGAGILEGRVGRLEAAVTHLEEAERLYRRLGDTRMAISMQSDRAHLERRAGHYARARALYTETLPAFLEGGHLAAVAHELECLAYLAIVADLPAPDSVEATIRAEGAVRLLGAAEALRVSLSAPLTAMERTEYDQHLAMVRAQLESEQLSRAWAEGRSLPLDEAVSQALAG
jgi:tetratricopeptide (TPR) repeat protein